MKHIIFNEHDYAALMNDGWSEDRGQSDKRSYTVTELFIYTKWLYWNIFKNYPDDERIAHTKNALVFFCKELLLHFNENLDYQKIEYLLKRVVNEPLRTCYPCYISKNEWNQILSLQTEEARKTYFACLLLAKFQQVNPVVRLNAPEDVKSYEYIGFTRKTKEEILRYANVKFSTQARKENTKITYSPFVEMHKRGLLDVRNKCKKNSKDTYLIYILPKADTDIKPEEIFLTITNYNAVEEYYNYGMKNSKYQICEKCGGAFRKTGKYQKYCKYCNRDDKLKFHYKFCIDCGKRFKCGNNDTKSYRCKECQQKTTKQQKREWKNNHK